MEENIENKVVAIIAIQMGMDQSQITRATRFVEDLNADSLDAVELIMEIEDTYEMSIPDDEAEKIHTVGDAIAYIEGRGPGGSGVLAKLPPTPSPPRKASTRPDELI